MMLEFGCLIISFLSTIFTLPYIINRLVQAGMTGKDVNKEEKPVVAEMGGIAIVIGASIGILFALFSNNFLFSQLINPVPLTAALATVLLIALIGVFDDLLDMHQAIKAVLPALAAIPLIVVKAGGSTVLTLPLFGPIDFGLLYFIVLIPLGVTVCSNLTNMLAGFNGLEASLGILIFAAAGIISLLLGSREASVICFSMLGALIAFLFFNKFPAKVFMGDVGTLLIGAALASATIIGNFETAGALLVIPHVIDFFIKLKNRFPSRQWWGEIKNGKLYPVDGKVRGLCQLVMKLSNGITETRLVLVIVLMELACAILAITFFAFQKKLL